jgi:hypothetical protein
VFVGFIGNALLGWAAGRKGFRRVGLEGPRNKPVTFALACVAAMMIWNTVGKLAPAFETWRSLWVPLVAVAAFLLGRYTMPRSLRLYERAKFLHETTFVGNWQVPRSAEELLEATRHPRLVEAARLYYEACTTQLRLGDEAETAAGKHTHHRNVVSICCQFSLLGLMTGDHVQAREAAVQAMAIARNLVAENDDTGNRQSLADAQASLDLADRVLAAHGDSGARA